MPKSKSPAATKKTSKAQSAARPKAVRATRKRVRKADAADDDDDADDDDEAVAAPDWSALAPADGAPPPLLLNASSQCCKRARSKLRDTVKLEPGAQIAWSPQALKVFEEHYSSSCEKIAGMPHSESDLMLSPADGTMNAATILSVESAPEALDLPGWSILRVKGVTIEGGEACDDDDQEYVLPFVGRADCDTDQHIVQLEVCVAGNTASLAAHSVRAGCVAFVRCELRAQQRPRCCTLTQDYRKSVATRRDHVVVRFAAPDDASMEEEWEGRVWDRKAWDPTDYPNSTFKSQCVLWYIKQKTPHGTPDVWLIDNEQTDTEVSPWECAASSHHALWRTHADPEKVELLDQNKLRLDRTDYRTLVPASESVALDERVLKVGPNRQAVREPELIERALKRLMSNEASSIFLDLPPESDADYYQNTPNPISLRQMESKLLDGEYASWKTFEDDVGLLCNNVRARPPCADSQQSLLRLTDSRPPPHTHLIHSARARVRSR